MIDTILNISILIVIIVTGLLLKQYLPAYASQKGKNLATKEDIADITNEIEKTRAEYSIELETLKSSLAKELELLKISQAELQINKTKEFISVVRLGICISMIFLLFFKGVRA